MEPSARSGMALQPLVHTRRKGDQQAQRVVCGYFCGFRWAEQGWESFPRPSGKVNFN